MKNGIRFGIFVSIKNFDLEFRRCQNDLENRLKLDISGDFSITVLQKLAGMVVIAYFFGLVMRNSIGRSLGSFREIDTKAANGVAKFL